MTEQHQDMGLICSCLKGTLQLYITALCGICIDILIMRLGRHQHSGDTFIRYISVPMLLIQRMIDCATLHHERMRYACLQTLQVSTLSLSM